MFEQRIDTCNHCPLHICTPAEGKCYCIHLDFPNGRKVERRADQEFPDWCPLEDAPDGAKGEAE